MTVQQAVRKLARNPGDSAAWETVFVDQRPRLLAYVSSLLLTFRISPGETAADVVHEVLLKLLENWHGLGGKIREPEHLQAYLRRSCRNLLIDRFRSSQHASQLVRFMSMGFSQTFQSDTEVQRRIFLDQVISNLSGDCAELLRRFVTEDLTPAEIADLQGVPASTFYSRWHRCVEKAKAFYMRAPEKEP